MRRTCGALLLALAACSGRSAPPANNPLPDAGPGVTPAPMDSGAPVEPMAGFAADPQGAGPRLWLDAKLLDDKTANVEIWAAELGPVFGYAGHVTFDASHLAIAADAAPPPAPIILGAGSSTNAIELWTQAPSSVGFGAVRKSPDLGEVSVVAKTLLGSVKLVASKGGPTPLALDRVTVRRADGTFVQVSTFGGTLTIKQGGA